VTDERRRGSRSDTPFKEDERVAHDEFSVGAFIDLHESNYGLVRENEGKDRERGRERERERERESE